MRQRKRGHCWGLPITWLHKFWGIKITAMVWISGASALFSSKCILGTFPSTKRIWRALWSCWVSLNAYAYQPSISTDSTRIIKNNTSQTIGWNISVLSTALPVQNCLTCSQRYSPLTSATVWAFMDCGNTVSSSSTAPIATSRWWRTQPSTTSWRGSRRGNSICTNI